MKRRQKNCNLQIINTGRSKVYSLDQKKLKRFQEYHRRIQLNGLQFQQIAQKSNLITPKHNINQIMQNQKTPRLVCNKKTTKNSSVVANLGKMKAQHQQPSVYLLHKISMTPKSSVNMLVNFASTEFKNKHQQNNASQSKNQKEYFQSKQFSGTNATQQACMPKGTFLAMGNKKVVKRIKTDHSKDSFSKDTQGSLSSNKLHQNSHARVINMNLNFNVNLSARAVQDAQQPSQIFLPMKSPKVHPNTSLSVYNLKNNFFRKNDNLNKKIKLLNTKKLQNETKKFTSALQSQRLVEKVYERHKQCAQSKQLLNLQLSPKPKLKQWPCSSVSKTKRGPFCIQNIVVIRKIGNGQHGDIYLVKSKQNNFLFVLKCFKKREVSLDFMIQQFKIQLFCENPNILRGYGYHIGRTQAYLAIEPGNGNLFRELKKNLFSQSKAADCIEQILNGLIFLHRNGIIHRDLKPQNIIVCGKNSDIYKISDFGWSTVTQTLRKTFCGTYEYVSPQVAYGAYYDFKIDSWSIGIMTFELITGKLPFDQRKIMRKQFSTLGRIPEIPNVTKNCQNFVERLLTINPEERMSIEQALKHNWFKEQKKGYQEKKQESYKQKSQITDNILSLIQ